MPDFDPTANIRRQSAAPAPARPSLTTEQQIDRIIGDASRSSAFVLEQMKACYDRDRNRIYANSNPAITPEAVYARAGPAASQHMAIAAVVAKSVVNFFEAVRTGDPKSELITDAVPQATITLPKLG